ncbi:MAG: carbohydrate kinase [Bacteroidales bacterium]|nr:carbohydrate kinase [Bacteroidales bacterium]MBP5317140.1 carbohydrate kinase [Bacteroidales bacterium]
MSKTERPVVGIGEILFDLLPGGAQLGGAPANFAYHVCCLGGRGVAVSAIGKDPRGAEIKSILTSKKLEAVLPQVDYPTGVVKVSLDGQGVPEYTIIEDVAWDNVPYTAEMKALAENAAAVCFGTLAQRSAVTRATIMSFIADMPDDGLKVYDINLRQHFYSREIIEASLKVADILKINDEEIGIVGKLFGMEGENEAVCRVLIESFGLRLVILTKGAEGSDVITMQEKFSVECPKVKIADTVGAGDSFTAAFVHAYLRGDPIEECHMLANRISAFVCSRSGAMPDYDRA